MASRTIGGIVDSALLALEKLLELPRNIKQAFLLVLDTVFVSAAMWSAIVLRLGDVQVQLGPMHAAGDAKMTA